MCAHTHPPFRCPASCHASPHSPYYTFSGSPASPLTRAPKRRHAQETAISDSALADRSLSTHSIASGAIVYEHHPASTHPIPACTTCHWLGAPVRHLQSTTCLLLSRFRLFLPLFLLCSSDRSLCPDVFCSGDAEKASCPNVKLISSITDEVARNLPWY